MADPDDELRQTFAKLGIIEEGPSVELDRSSPADRFRRLDDDALLWQLRFHGSDTPFGVIAEIRRRKLMTEIELASWFRR